MILNRQREVRVATPPLELFLGRVKKELKVRNTDVTICLVSDAEIARMNHEFRKKNGPTDVLSFPDIERSTPRRVTFSARTTANGSARRNGVRRSGKRARSSYLGDIAISPSTARRNAKEVGHSLETELRVLILHGVLHLLGYDHETDRGQMNRLEQRLRRRFRLP